MEKILTDSEKIRRAEEIYARRRGIDLIEKNEKGKEIGVYRFLFKTLLLINIVVLVLCIQNKENVFNEDFLNKFSSYSGAINQKVNGLIDKLKEEEKEEEETKETIAPEEQNGIENNIEEIQNKEETGTSENQTNKENSISEESYETIEEKIKNGYSFIKPIEGTVTSFFGDRESKYQNVSGYHTGIDIGAESGTIIKSSIEGTVTQVSNIGDYRKAFEN